MKHWALPAAQATCAAYRFAWPPWARWFVAEAPVPAQGRAEGHGRAALCQKAAVVGKDQETSFHAHKVKLKDIIPRGLMHRFYGQPGHGPVFMSEVSPCEDEAPLQPLWNGVPR